MMYDIPRRWKVALVIAAIVGAILALVTNDYGIFPKGLV